MNNCAGRGGNRQIIDFLHGSKFTDGTHGNGCVALCQVTGRQVHIFCCQQTGKRRGCQSVARQLDRVNGNTHLIGDTAGKAGRGNALDTLQTIDYVILQKVIQGLQIHIFRLYADGDWHGIDIHFNHHRIACCIGQGGLHLVDFISHIHRSHVDVRTVHKLQQHHGRVG